MAQQYILINTGDKKDAVTKGTGAPAIAAGQIALTFDPTGLRKGDLILAMEYFEQFLFTTATFPPS